MRTEKYSTDFVSSFRQTFGDDLFLSNSGDTSYLRFQSNVGEGYTVFYTINAPKVKDKPPTVENRAIWVPYTPPEASTTGSALENHWAVLVKDLISRKNFDEMTRGLQRLEGRIRQFFPDYHMSLPGTVPIINSKYQVTLAEGDFSDRLLAASSWISAQGRECVFVSSADDVFISKIESQLSRPTDLYFSSVKAYMGNSSSPISLEGIRVGNKSYSDLATSLSSKLNRQVDPSNIYVSKWIAK